MPGCRHSYRKIYSGPTSWDLRLVWGRSFFTKMTFREMKSLFMSSIAQIHHSSSIFHLSHTFWENMFLLILSSHRLGTTGKKPLCCVEGMHIYKASPSNSIRYKPVNFHVTHSSFQVYIANCINIYYYTSTVVPATAGHRWFRGKVALRGRWPLVRGNGHMRHYVKSNTHIRQHIFHSTCTTL